MNQYAIVKTKFQIMSQDNRIQNQNSDVVATFLNLLLADEYVLYTKTRTAHWNLDGENYFELHVFLENQFNTLDYMIDEIAEQIRSTGHFATSSLKDFLSVIQMNSDSHDFDNSKEIFEMLRNDHDTMVSVLEHEIVPISKKLEDQSTAIFITELMEKHKKMAWMLRFFMSNPEFNEKKQIQRINDMIGN